MDEAIYPMESPNPWNAFSDELNSTSYRESLDYGMPNHGKPDESFEYPLRARLTKEQDDVLEAQFQLHPKPNSPVMCQLAAETRMTLPRVTVSFGIHRTSRATENDLRAELVPEQAGEGKTAKEAE